MNYIYNWFKPSTISPQYARLSLVLDDLIKNNLLSSDSSIADLSNILDREIAADINEFRVYAPCIINADDIRDMQGVIADLIGKNKITKGSIVNNFYYILTNGRNAVPSTVSVIINGTTMWSKQPKYTSADLITLHNKINELDNHIDEEKIKKLRQVIKNNPFTYEEQLAFINKIHKVPVCTTPIPEPDPFETKESYCEKVASVIKLEEESLKKHNNLCNVTITDDINDKIKSLKASFTNVEDRINITRDTGVTHQLHAEDYAKRQIIYYDGTGDSCIKAVDNFLTDMTLVGDDPLQMHLLREHSGTSTSARILPASARFLDMVNTHRASVGDFPLYMDGDESGKPSASRTLMNLNDPEMIEIVNDDGSICKTED